MSIKIRLARGGRKGKPFYRINVADSRAPRDGKFIEKIGTYDPLLEGDNKQRVTVNKQRAEYWLSVGATPSQRVALFLCELGIKGADKYKPEYTPKKKGDGAKKKAQEAAKMAEEKAKEAEAAAAEEAERPAAEVAEKQEKATSEQAPKEEVKSEPTKEEEPKAEKSEEEGSDKKKDDS